MKVKRLLKSAILVVSWFIFPPLYILLAYVWKIMRPWQRIGVSLIAPMTLLLLFISVMSSKNYIHQQWRASRSEINLRTGIEFPRLIQRSDDELLYGPTLQGDFTKVKYYQLDTTNTRLLYATLNQMVDSCNRHQNNFTNRSWSKNMNRVFFSYSDGYEFLNLVVDQTDGTIKVSFGEL
ncbi:hypothetical protein [Sunxiuqinia rutila]|uniref:hypothetical protein n=1 Tax=Sunxiuqinia rutila TaxID=1397841 RepID=UPI003D36EB60